MTHHKHLDTVEYEEQTYSRSYEHNHLFDHKAHVHAHSWTGTSRNKTQHFVMSEDVTPVTEVTRIVTYKGVVG
ncbi:hypothetical protein LCGC14_2514110 [marine sediment metagenome]|uniref:Uncharacterized protein n=1 Tax=marine sediment metagenome TaxID=412755 RepID=A0A0F9D9Z5_9ZZZZ